MHKIIDRLCATRYVGPVIGTPGTHSHPFRLLKGRTMFKVEDFQQQSKEQLDAAVASARTVANGFQAIAAAFGDYSKKSYEDTKGYVEKLSGVKSLDKALEVQSEYAKTAYDTFVVEAQKIGQLYSDLAKESYKPFEGLVSKYTQH